ncbi:hypothetical protein FVE85_5612 [Porphyridium purpureum]|uniref:Uncharacterized protein n=1 Tax=Porphyridium purpureum TaxID=35688 RepID=A0A5J4Z5V8_PORPP|nr:hypothetical protein FVE85_5612 [Porphyridium purpureum]|eukprot:POR9548..scf295_1
METMSSASPDAAVAAAASMSSASKRMTMVSLPFSSPSSPAMSGPPAVLLAQSNHVMRARLELDYERLYEHQFKYAAADNAAATPKRARDADFPAHAQKRQMR